MTFQDDGCNVGNCVGFGYDPAELAWDAAAHEHDGDDSSPDSSIMLFFVSSVSDGAHLSLGGPTSGYITLKWSQ